MAFSWLSDWRWSSPLTKWGKTHPPSNSHQPNPASIPLLGPGILKFTRFTVALTTCLASRGFFGGAKVWIFEGLLVLKRPERTWNASIVFHLHSIMNFNDWIWVVGWFWENIMLKYVWLLTGDFGDIFSTLFNFLVRFQEFFVAQPHLSNKMETPHDSPVSLTGKELKDGQMGLLHTRPKGSSWKSGENMLEKWLPGTAWCFTVLRYIPQKCLLYIIYIYQDLKKIVNYTGPVLQICFPKKQTT